MAVITGEQQDTIKNQLRTYIGNCGAKPGSKKALDIEDKFLVGVFATLQALDPEGTTTELTSLIPPLWGIYRLSGRSIL